MITFLAAVAFVYGYYWLYKFTGSIDYDPYNYYPNKDEKDDFVPVKTVVKSWVAPVRLPFSINNTIAENAVAVLKIDGVKEVAGDKDLIKFEDKHLQMLALVQRDGKLVYTLSIAIRIGCEWRIVFRIEKTDKEVAKDIYLYSIVENIKGGWEESLRKLSYNYKFPDVKKKEVF